MRIKGYMLLIINFALSSPISIPTVDVEIGDAGESNNIKEDLTLDDIREPLIRPRSSIFPGNGLWTSPVPYVLDESLDLNAKGVIMRAFDQFRVKSCIDFKPWDAEEYYIEIQKLDGCWSNIGRLFANGQNLSIGAGCDNLATVEHEILHALGFYHEQSRYDRDDYVQIALENIITGQENNFIKVGSNESITHRVPYDYMSVMHYGKDAFTNGNGSTIITTDPQFQQVIGQRLGMSPRDVQELNVLYNCNSTIAFMFYCDFSDGSMCKMSTCSQSDNSWEVVTQIDGGLSSDHPSPPSEDDQKKGYFIHTSTASGQEGDTTQLKSDIMRPSRKCNVQCLQFYYFHTGNESDKLNIWIREFQDQQDTTGTLRCMGQLTGPPTSHWKIYHVSLDATKLFQVVFEVQKGAGSSTGGFSIDDINLSETECPHLTWQVDDFEKLLNTSDSGTRMYSPRQYSREGYAYRVAVILYQTYFGMFLQLLSGEYDEQLEWPCLQKQITFQLLDQSSNMQLQMSKQMSFTTNENDMTSNGTLIWNNPRENGTRLFNESDELVYGGSLWGFLKFATLEELQSGKFLKEGRAIFMFNFEDLTPLVNGTTLPCPQVRQPGAHLPTNMSESPCVRRYPSSVSVSATDDSISGFSAGMVASPCLILVSALILLMARCVSH